MRPWPGPDLVLARSYLGPSGVPVGHVQSPTDHEGLPGAAFGVVGDPATSDGQTLGIYLADDDVPCVLISRVDDPEPALVHHQINVRVSAPRVVVHVVIT